MSRPTCVQCGGTSAVSIVQHPHRWHATIAICAICLQGARDEILAAGRRPLPGGGA